MTRGRKASSTELAPTPELNALAMAEAGQAVDLQATVAAAYTLEQALFAQRIGERFGRRRMVETVTKIGNVTDLMELAAIKESKVYRGKQYVGDEGKLVTITSWEDFCVQVEGRSREAVDLDLSNLKTLGAQAVDAIQRLGFGPSQMRAMRALPDDSRSAIIEAAQAGDKDAFVDLAETLISRHQAEKKKLESKVAEHAATLEARQTILNERTAELDAIKEAELRRRTAPLPEREAMQLDELRDATLAAEQALAYLATVVDETTATPATEAVAKAARQSLDYVAQRLAEAAQQRGLALNLDDEVIPASMQAVRATRAEGGARN